MKIPAPARRQIAGQLGINEQYLYQVLTRRRQPDPELAVSIERESRGAVMRWDLRPEDWHRIWPELVGRNGAPRAQIRKAA